MYKYEGTPSFTSAMDYFSNKVRSLSGKHKYDVTISEESEQGNDCEYSEENDEDTIVKNEVNSNIKILEVNESAQEELCFNLDFKENNIMQAFVNSEIFGKPKARTRRRR